MCLFISFFHYNEAGGQKQEASETWKNWAQLHQWTLCLYYPPLKILWFLTVSQTNWTVWRCHVRLCENVHLCPRLQHQHVWEKISNYKEHQKKKVKTIPSISLTFAINVPKPELNTVLLPVKWANRCKSRDILPLFSQAQALYLTGHLCYLILQPLRQKRREGSSEWWNKWGEKKMMMLSFKEQNLKRK